ncbi:MAG: PAS domain-containing protein [Nitrospira sp.]|nr:PAS domain-containing protein [Nitrospira sp.]
MNSPSGIDGTVFAELTHLRRHVRELQQALAQSEQDRRLAQASTLEAAQVGTWEWQADTNRVSWSAETERILGLLPGSFVGTYEGFLALVHPDDRQRLSTAIAMASTSEPSTFLNTALSLHMGTPDGWHAVAAPFAGETNRYPAWSAQWKISPRASNQRWLSKPCTKPSKLRCGSEQQD